MCALNKEEYFWCKTKDDWDYCSPSSECKYLRDVPSGYSNCTNHLKNRIARFEYNYYPGYWMAAPLKLYWATDGIKGSELFTTDEGYAWKIHPSTGIYNLESDVVSSESKCTGQT